LCRTFRSRCLRFPSFLASFSTAPSHDHRLNLFRQAKLIIHALNKMCPL
jgi:hypothetical protein